MSEPVPEFSAPSEAAVDREIRDALSSLDLPALRGVRAFPGFRRKLRGLIGEISAAATSAAEFSEAIARLPCATAMQRAVAVVYARVEERLAARGLALPRRRARLVEMLPGSANAPRIAKFSAAGRVQEAAEIARRIAERLARGESAGDVGVIVRQTRTYVPLLRAAFSRYAIPAAFHFAEPLQRQSPSRFCASVVESLLDDWNLERLHEAVVLPVSGLGGTPEGDRLDFEMRARMPGRGFDGLPLLEERFGEFSEWAGERRTPRRWAAALAALLPAKAIEAWTQAVSEAASALPDRECTLAQFWPEASHAVAAAAIRPAESAKDSVAVVDAMEAQQWRFRAAYVCGLLEGEFPAHPPGDAFFDNAARRELTRLGIPMRSSDDIEAEERALIDVAVSRAECVTLSWPAVTPAGEESLPSFVLETFPGEAVSAQPPPPKHIGLYRPPSKAGVVQPEATQRLMGERKTWRPTEIECFLQCPFQYLGRYTLKLLPPPPGPAKRFDARAQGSLAHKILRRVSEHPSLDLTAVVDEELRTLARTDRIPESHVMLWHRTAMLRVLRLFLDTPPEREGWHREYEWPFEFDLVEGMRIKGRIDRFDSRDGRAFAIDYKYSKAGRLRSSEAVQGGLYLLGLRAAGYTPEGFAYVALREEGEIVRHAPEPLMPESRERTIAAVTAIGQGQIAARPADATLCRFCDFRSACRISESAGSSIAGAGSGE